MTTFPGYRDYSLGYNERGEEVCYFRRKVMVPRREAAPERQRPYSQPGD